MKIKKTTYLLPALTFAVCTAGVIGGSAHAASTSTARTQQRETRYEERLTKAIDTGKLALPAGVSKNDIIAEHKALVQELEAASKTDRKSTRERIKTQAKSWADQHNIAAKWLFGVHRTIK